MTKEQLIKMGLTEEQAVSVMKELDGNFVTKTRFNEVNTELKTTKDTVKEQDEQLETLTKSTGDVEALKTQITTLQVENKTKDESHETAIKLLKFDTALSTALSGTKAKNPETVKPLLKAFLEKAEMDGDSIKGLDVELKKLTDSEETKFLFNTDTKPQLKPNFKGITPGEPNKEDVKPTTLGEAIKAHYEVQVTN